MQSEHTVSVVFPVREVSLGELAALWSMLMALLPEVRRCSAHFRLRGKAAEHLYTYEDADELARSGLEFRPGELKLVYVSVHSASLAIRLREHWNVRLGKFILARPNGLVVEVTGASEREVLAARDAIAQWGERHLRPRRGELWAKLGVFAAGFATVGAAAPVMDLSVSQAAAYMFFWFLMVVLGSSVLPEVIPPLRRWSTELRILSTPARRGGGHGRGTPAPLPPDPAIGSTMGAGDGAVREKA